MWRKKNLQYAEQKALDIYPYLFRHILESTMNPTKPVSQSTFRIACSALLLLTASVSAYANDNDRITQLEKQVQELKLRLSNLEAQRATSHQPSTVNTTRPAATPAQAPVVRQTDPKVLTKWQNLTRGMSPNEVRGILGEPLKILASSGFTYWDYPNKGSLTFHHGRLNGWTEPN